MEEKKIATDSIKDQIYEILKDEILSGELKSGEKLVEQAIADRFHVSRSPVREAIKQLTGDGLLENITNKGNFVKKPTVQELNEMQEMRELLEVYAVARAVERMTDADREELLHLREEIISSANQKDSVMYLALERRIWTAIIGMAGNAYLADIYGKTYAMVIQNMCAEEGRDGYNVNASGRRCASTVFIMLVSGLILYLVYGVGARDLADRLALKEKRRKRREKIVARLRGAREKAAA